MLRLLVLALVVSVHLVLGSVVSVASNKPLLAVDLELPNELRVNNMPPRQIACFWQESVMSGGDLQMERMCDYGVYHLFIRHNLIQTVSLFVYARNVRLGDLVLAWGTPSGFKHQNMLSSVYWPGRYVYLVTRPIRPDSIVSVVVWDDNVQSSEWRGFTSLVQP